MRTLLKIPPAALLLAFAGGTAAALLWAASPVQLPRLIGFGCEGALIMFAEEEDLFPRCRAIEAFR